MFEITTHMLMSNSFLADLMKYLLIFFLVLVQINDRLKLIFFKAIYFRNVLK